MDTRLPGADLLLVKLQRCRQLPEEERDPAVQAFLDGYDVVSEVVAALPLTGPPPSDTQVALALAKYLRVRVLTYVETHQRPAHENSCTAQLAGAMRPFVGLQCVNGKYTIAPGVQQLAAFAAQPVGTATLLQLLKAAVAFDVLHVTRQHEAEDLTVTACLRHLGNSQLPALSAQLAQLSASSAISSSELVSAEELCYLFLQLAATGPAIQGDLETALQCWRPAVAMAEQLWPGHPSTLDMYGSIAWAARCHVHTQLLRLQQALQAAQQHSNYLEAYLGLQMLLAVPRTLAAGHGTPVGLQYSRPSQLLLLLQQADAAYARCKRLLPLEWMVEYEAQRQELVPVEQLRQLVAQNIDSFDASVMSREIRQRLCTQAASSVKAAAEAYTTEAHAELLACSGCKQVALGLRNCAACKEAHYCSRECQKAHWPQHKAACKAAQAAKASQQQRCTS